MTDFLITHQKLQDDVVAISIKGFLDTDTYMAVEQTINRFFAQHIYKLIVDLSQVDYFSSAGAGVLVAAVGVARENQGNIVLVRPQPHIKEVFDPLGLTPIFIITDDIASALKTLQG